MVVVQGGQEPEFEVRPDPGKLIQTATTIPNILEAIGRTNLIDSPGLMEYNHQLVLSLVSGQVRTPDEISNIVVKTTPAGAPVRIGDVAAVTPSVKPVYTIVTANEKPAVLLSVYRQPDGNTVTVAERGARRGGEHPPDAASGRAIAPVLRPVGDRQQFDRQRAGRHSARA